MMIKGRPPPVKMLTKLANMMAQVIHFLREPVLFDYCMYGHVLRKRTAFWASFDLLGCGFKAALCRGDCMAMCTGARQVHMVHWEETRLMQRQHIPEQVPFTWGWGDGHSSSWPAVQPEVPHRHVGVC